MKKGLVLSVLFILAVCTCCTTTGTASSFSPVSLYRYDQETSSERVIFIGESQSENQRQAELLAYTDLHNKLYKYLGLDSLPESYRELSTTGEIKSYNLIVEDIKTNYREGVYTVAVVAGASKELLSQDRSPDSQKEEEIAGQVESLILAGDECMKNNNDVEGLKYYLKSMQLSYGLTLIKEEYSFATMLEEVLNVIDAIDLEISKTDPIEATCTISVTRHDSIISSKIKNGNIKAKFTSKDAMGESYTDSFVYTTNKRGMIHYKPQTYNMARYGIVTFVMDIEEEIEAIRSLSATSASALSEALNKKAVRFGYSRRYSGDPIGINTQCFGAMGQYLDSKELDGYITENFIPVGARIYVLESVEEESEFEMLQRFRKMYPEAGYLVDLKVGISEEKETKLGISSVSTEGTVVVYDLKNDSIVYDSGISYANGFGNTMEEAREKAFVNFVSMMYTLLGAFNV